MNRINIVFLFLVSLFATNFLSCRDCESKYIDKNLVLLYGEKEVDNSIIYCDKNTNCCSGPYILPKYENKFDSQGNNLEYVESVTVSKKWIIAKTVFANGNENGYWLLDRNKLNEMNMQKRDSLLNDLRSSFKGPMTAMEIEQITK